MSTFNVSFVDCRPAIDECTADVCFCMACITDKVDLCIVPIVYCAWCWLGLTAARDNGMNGMENSLPALDLL